LKPGTLTYFFSIEGSFFSVTTIYSVFIGDLMLDFFSLFKETFSLTILGLATDNETVSFSRTSVFFTSFSA